MRIQIPTPESKLKELRYEIMGNLNDPDIYTNQKYVVQISINKYEVQSDPINLSFLYKLKKSPEFLRPQTP
jgi:hypothetical protein